MKKTIYTVQALMMSAFMLSNYVQAATPTAESLAYTCFGCHGVNGNSQGPATPSIAGLDKNYIADTMQAFKTDKRPGTIMGRIAKGYSDEEIELVAGFFAAQKSNTAALIAEPKVVASMPNKLDETWNAQMQFALLDYLSSDKKTSVEVTSQIDIQTTNPLEVKR